MARPRRRAALALLLALGAPSCHPPEQSWKLGAIRTMKTPSDPPLTCPVSTESDQMSAQRAACKFSAGALAADTLGVASDVSAAIPVRHIVVVMKENRSFDHLLGKLHELGQSDVEAIPAGLSNPDSEGTPVAFHHAATTCIHADPDHGWGAMHSAVDGGKMDGFVKTAALSTSTDGHFAVSYYEPQDLPFFYFLANTWAINDRHFSSVRSGTDPNRDFLLLGTNAGEQDTNTQTPDPSNPSIFLELMRAGFTWGVYSDGTPLSGTLQWDHDSPGVHYLADLIQGFDDGTLPNVAFVDGRDYVEDDHPPADLQVGEAWLDNVYTHAINSPEWPRMALIWAYDEGGGFADHVPPPSACVARPTPLLPSSPSWPAVSDDPYFELGPRVPLVVISPYAKPHYVSHVVEEHTAITRFIETVFNLPALTARDANSSALLDMFDFSCDPPMLTPPPAPAPGTGGCVPGL